MKTQKYPAAIETAFDKIMESEMFRLDGPEIDLPAALIELGNAISDNETDETLWSLGEFGECSLDSLLIGAYWALTEWHAGQYSQSYAAMCALGGIYFPGHACAPQGDDEPEFYPYTVVGEWFQDHPSRN